MSKAFTKENDGAAGPDGLDEELDAEEAAKSGIPQGSRNYITPAGAEKLKQELKQLLHVERPQVVQTVQWAAGNGDRSENGDYIYGKRRLREIDRRIRFLTKRLELAEIVDPAQQKSEQILFGATVTVVDEDGRKRRYRIVGIDESDPGKGEVSWTSPVARALLGAKLGETVTLRTPKGPEHGEELEVVEIRYLP